MMRQRRVRSGEVELSVFEDGEPGAPPVLLLHGFPDDHGVYSRVVDELRADHHVATFDMRGVGGSTAPRAPGGYRIGAILTDITAVIDAVFGPGAAVHLVGHDWGSVLGFSYVAEGGGRPRVRSFTSVSGPHVALMWSAAFRLLGAAGTRRAALHQMAASAYVFALNVPLLPELLLRARPVAGYRRALRKGGVPAGDPYLDVTPSEVSSRMRHAIGLYRQNALRPPPMPRRRSIDLPLIVLVPEHDPFVRPEVSTFLGEYATALEVRRLAAGHWVPRSHPREVASAVRDLVRATREEAPCV
jgi:pimeloyl-ACP methyl ester carboxylesterase